MQKCQVIKRPAFVMSAHFGHGARARFFLLFLAVAAHA